MILFKCLACGWDTKFKDMKFVLDHNTNCAKLNELRQERKKYRRAENDWARPLRV